LYLKEQTLLTMKKNYGTLTAFAVLIITLLAFNPLNLSAQADDDNYDILVNVTLNADLSANDVGQMTYGTVSSLVPNPMGATISVSATGMLNFTTTTPGIYVYGMPVSDGNTTETIRLFILAKSAKAFLDPNSQEAITNAQLQNEFNSLLRSHGIKPSADLFEAQSDKLSTLAESADFTVYPNPATSQISITNHDQIERLMIVDATGKTVKKIVNPQQSNIDLSNLSTGQYFIKFHTAVGLKTKSLLIQ